MAETLKLEIVTPDGTAYSEEVEMVTLPGVEGQLGMYPRHVPLLTQIVPGEVIVSKGGEEYFLAVGEGLIEATGDHVALLTDMAIEAEKIDEAKAEEARQRAEAPPPREAFRRRSSLCQFRSHPLAGATARETPSAPQTEMSGEGPKRARAATWF